MMKNANKIILLSCIFGLTCCSKSTYIFNYDDYKLEITSHSNEFKILQLGDIHYGNSCDLKLEFRYLDKLIKKADPDMILLSGDVFMDATKETVKLTFEHFDSYNIPWTAVWGNHDKQGFYSPYFVVEEIQKCKNAKFVDFEDDVYGESNFFIDVNDSTGDTKWQIYCIDSNSYHYENLFSYNYDVVHDDQIDWYKKCVEQTIEKNGKVIPSICFFHIPTEEFEFATRDLGETFDNEEYGRKDEQISKGYKENNLIETMLELGSTKGVFCSHDHVNCFKVDYEGISLVYGVKTGNCLYHPDDKIGGLSISLQEDGNFSITKIYQGYGDLNG